MTAAASTPTSPSAASLPAPLVELGFALPLDALLLALADADREVVSVAETEPVAAADPEAEEVGPMGAVDCPSISA